MKSSSLSLLKKELEILPSAQLVELCTRIAKYRKENKELLNYLLFESHDEERYIKSIKIEVEQLFKEINTSNIYFAKKSIRKILRLVNKHSKYSGIKTTVVELLIHFCQQINVVKIDYKKSPALLNLYNKQLAKINNLVSVMHEDLQYDYQRELLTL